MLKKGKESYDILRVDDCKVDVWLVVDGIAVGFAALTPTTAYNLLHAQYATRDPPFSCMMLD